MYGSYFSNGDCVSLDCCYGGSIQEHGNHSKNDQQRLRENWQQVRLTFKGRGFVTQW